MTSRETPPSAATADDLSPANARLALAAVLLVALLLRAVGLGSGLPLLLQVDEPLVIDRVEAFLGGDLNPRWFYYPSLTMYLSWALVKVWGAFQRFEPAHMYMAGRALAAILGTLTVWLAWVMGRQLAGRRAGVLSAALVALFPIHVQLSHQAGVDVPAAFFTSLALWLLWRAEASGQAVFGVAAAVACGLAASVKYSGALALVALAPWLAARHRLRRIGAWLGVAVAIGAAFVLAFVAGTPYSVVERQRFLDDLAGQARHAREGHLGYESASWLYLIVNPHGSLWSDADPVSFTLVLIGFGYGAWLAWRRRSPALAGSLLFVLVTYGFFSAWRTKFVRWLLPALPVLLVFAGCWLSQAAAQLRGRLLRCAVLAAVLAAPLVRSLEVLGGFVKPDTRTLATAWVTANVPAGATLCLDPHTAFVDNRHWFSRTLALPAGAAGPYTLVRNPSALEGCRYVLTSSEWKQRYERREAVTMRPAEARDGQAFYRRLAERAQLVQRFTPEHALTGPEIEIYDLQPR
jgi:4-amino-4-deoxy-L-arabinose transferase-like glycosyltransferase